MHIYHALSGTKNTLMQKLLCGGKVADKVHVASTLVTRRRSQWTSTSLEASVAKFVTFHGNVMHFPSEMYCTNLGNVLRYEAFHRSRVSNYIDPSLDVEVLSYTAAIVLGSSSEERFKNRSTAFQHHVINKRYHVQGKTKERNCQNRLC